MPLPSPDIATLPATDVSTKAASTSFVSTAVAAAITALQHRIDIASYKKTINAYQTGGVSAMYAYSCSGDMGSPATIVFFAGSDVAGGDFETLVLTPWLMGSPTPASGPAGLGQTSSQAAATVASLRNNAAIIQLAAPAVPTTVAASPTDIVSQGLANAMARLPASDPGVPGALWLDGGALVSSQ